MRRFLLQLHCMTIGILFLFFYSCCFALDSDRYPWYFIPNGIKECWNDMGPTSRGEGALIDVLDTKIKFVSILKGKEFFSKNYNSPCPRSLNAEEELHGTAMAGLIAADHERLVCVEVDKDLCDIDGKIMVAGIAPEAKIISREWIPEGDLVKTVASSLDKRTPTNRHGKKIRFDDLNASETKLILLSLSAGIQTRDAKDIQEKIDNWLTKIQPEVRDNPYFLIIAAVGNIGGEFKERTYGYITAIVPASKAGRDVIIRVGAITQYNSTVSPKVHRNSRCGKDYVDIMAPGQTIPALTPSANATILSGTSYIISNSYRIRGCGVISCLQSIS